MIIESKSLLSSAYMLVFHGSKDARTQYSMQNLVSKVNTLLNDRNSGLPNLGIANMQISSPEKKLPLVSIGELELAPLSLHEQIQQFALRAKLLQYGQVKVLPVFLLPGIHVEEDMYAEIERARIILGDRFEIHHLSYLGSYLDLTELLRHKFVAAEADARILISHGSTRVDGNRHIEQMAKRLGAVSTYCSVAPSLREKIEMAIVSGKKRIAIQPYLLFEGTIFNSIAREIATLQAEFPQVEILFGQPLGTIVEIAPLIVSQLLES